MKKKKIITMGGVFMLTLFFVAFHFHKNEERTKARQRAYQLLKEYNQEKAKWDEICAKSEKLQSSIQKNIEKIKSNAGTLKLESVSKQTTQQKKGNNFAEHQRRINNLPRDFGKGIVYVNCTYDEARNEIVFHYVLSFDFKGKVAQEEYDALIQQMKRTPDWKEACSLGFSDILVYWNMPSRLAKYSMLNEKWL